MTSKAKTNGKTPRKVHPDDWYKRQAELEYYEDLRDDLMSLVRNSEFTFEAIHGLCGPHPHTLLAWDKKDVKKPQMGKMLATARVLGLEFGGWVRTRDVMPTPEQRRAQ